jgi:hypothetical protein
MSMQLGSCVSRAHTHVNKAPNVRAIMGMQNVWAGCVFNAPQDVWTCGYSAAAALLTTRNAPLQCQATQQHGVILRTECDVAGRQDKTYTMSLKTSFATSS